MATDSYTAKLAALVKTQSGDPMSDHEAEQLYSLALYMAGLLDRLLPEDRKFVVCNRHGFTGLEYCPECTSYGSPGPNCERCEELEAVRDDLLRVIDRLNAEKKACLKPTH